MRRGIPALLLVVAAACSGTDAGSRDLGDTAATRGDTTTTRADAKVAVLDPTAAVESSHPRMRMVFLGTSLTAGLGLRFPNERWPEVIGSLADSAGHPIRVINAGVSGDTSAGGLRRLDWVLDEPIDVLVIELGANDGLRGLSVDELESNLREIIARTRQRWPRVEVVVAGMEAPRNLGTDYVERFRSVFPRVASDTNSALIPFLLEGVAARPELNQADGIHPTAEGHRQMALVAWPVIDSLLSRRSEDS